MNIRRADGKPIIVMRSGDKAARLINPKVDLRTRVLRYLFNSKLFQKLFCRY